MKNTCKTNGCSVWQNIQRFDAFSCADIMQIGHPDRATFPQLSHNAQRNMETCGNVENKDINRSIIQKSFPCDERRKTSVLSHHW